MRNLKTLLDLKTEALPGRFIYTLSCSEFYFFILDLFCYFFCCCCFILKAAKTGYSDDFTLDDRFVSSAANKISPADQEQRSKQRAIRGLLGQTKLLATL